MTTPSFYKPARVVHRLMTCIAVSLLMSIFGAPIFSIVGAELVGWAFIVLCGFLFIVLVKVGMHIRHRIKRDSIPAGSHNKEVLKAFVSQYPEMAKAEAKAVTNAREMTWGDCVRFRKEVNTVLLRRKTDSFLASLDRLKIG